MKVGVGYLTILYRDRSWRRPRSTFQASLRDRKLLCPRNSRTFILTIMCPQWSWLLFLRATLSTQRSYSSSLLVYGLCLTVLSNTLLDRTCCWIEQKVNCIWKSIIVFAFILFVTERQTLLILSHLPWAFSKYTHLYHLNKSLNI